ncbi:MAG: hypothetical protein J3R72DRAFT_178103 [Linnemannia gamsii]|nr:MAG: hypothetical protein J3R72DRAFT_178103 [Linnemannia gamsii]
MSVVVIVVVSFFLSLFLLIPQPPISSSHLLFSFLPSLSPSLSFIRSFILPSLLPSLFTHQVSSLSLRQTRITSSHLLLLLFLSFSRSPSHSISATPSRFVVIVLLSPSIS